jgi:hypothetical protein
MQKSLEQKRKQELSFVLAGFGKRKNHDSLQHLVLSSKRYFIHFYMAKEKPSMVFNIRSEYERAFAPTANIHPIQFFFLTLNYVRHT